MINSLGNFPWSNKKTFEVRENIEDFCRKSNKWLDKVIFNKVLNPIFRYKDFSDLMIKPNSESDLPYKIRLQIYNRVYQLFQYWHLFFVWQEWYRLILNLLWDLQENWITTNLIWIWFNGILALHIRYNRERVKNIIERVRN